MVRPGEPDGVAEGDGIFAWQDLRAAAKRGVIRSSAGPIPPQSFQPASLDLRLGAVAIRLRCSFLPGAASVEERLAEFAMGEFDISEGGILESGRPYLIPLMEELRLPRGVRGQTNPKSSTGRLDIFTRVITDSGAQFDEVEAGYKGPLYLEVFSRTFTIKVKAGRALNQLRLFRKKPYLADSQLRREHLVHPLAYRGANAIGAERLPLGEGLLLGVDLAAGGPVGYCAKRNSHLLDLDQVHAYEPTDYWEHVYSEPGSRLILEPEEFYLLLSKESVVIPPHLASDMVAFDPTSGELRTHYAGFFDPGFGFATDASLKGSRAVMEVRAHDVPFAIEDGQRVAKLTFSPMVAEPSVLYGGQATSSQYQGQAGLRILPKQFRAPGLDLGVQGEMRLQR